MSETTTEINKKRNIFITGGAGFIGSYLCSTFLQQGASVYILDDLSTGSRKNLVVHPDLHLFVGSIMDKDFMLDFRKFKFDLIIHLASIVGMRLATRYQQKTYDIATAGTQNVLDIFNNIPVVLFSSSAVYGLNNGNNLSESRPISYDGLLESDGGKKGYCCGKYEMEQIGLTAAEKGRKVMILRPFNVIGIKQVCTYGMVVPNFIEMAFAQQPITIFDDGNQVRSFSCVKHFVKLFFELLRSEKVWIKGTNIINVGTPVGSSIAELADIVIGETGSVSCKVFKPYKEIFLHHTDVRYRVPNTIYVESIVGKNEWPSLRQIVKGIIHFKHIVQKEEGYM
ncbi:MAG: NAD-dependent epimerase/dehydratase family protein [Chitinophagaceae bacterium]